MRTARLFSPFFCQLCCYKCHFANVLRVVAHTSMCYLGLVCVVVAGIVYRMRLVQNSSTATCTSAFTHRAAGVSSTDWVLLARCVGVLGGRCLVLICHVLFRQPVCCWRFRWLPRTPLCGGVRPRPQRVEDAGQHDIFTQQCRSGHAGRNHLRRGWLRRQRVPQHDGGVQPRDGRVERLHQDPVCPL